MEKKQPQPKELEDLCDSAFMDPGWSDIRFTPESFPFARLRHTRFCHWVCLLVVMVFCLPAVPAKADRFTIIDETGSRKQVDGKLHGSGQGAVAIELPDGRIELYTQAALLERDNSVEWQPETPEQIARGLADRFGPEVFRSKIDGNYVIGMVLMDPLERSAETAADGFLRKAARFMNQVDDIFEDFATSARLTIHDAEVPLVLLIFESDSDFNSYATTVMKGQGLSVNRISGFYDGLTNYLSIRMAECATFEVPLHEAIHQQVYNRGILQRLAPVPAWFNEGIATGFEANKDRIRSGPIQVHSRFATRVADIQNLNWDVLISDDEAFRGDVLAGDAYCLAWCLHWLLVNEHRDAYRSYVELLSKKEPLAKQDPQFRAGEFVQLFGDDIPALERQFSQALKIAMRKQRFRPEKPTPGMMVSQQNLAELEIKATTRVDRGGVLEVQGRLRNMNPLRSLTFAVNLVTDGGTYAQWIVPNVDSERTVPLPLQYATRVMPGQTGQASSTFRVEVISVLPTSSQAREWTQGSPPVPLEGR
ncbi:MAG: DUF1570 domain-containing protein [Planctomycetaceae bacterium]|nr:DUF1570 domain-containing protein [Planctomycetaceae bacterium]